MHPQQWPLNGSDMAAAIAQVNWASTPFGPLDTWPASFKTLVGSLLDSPLPTLLLWGKDLRQLYNDAFRDIMGGRHPCGLGQATRECWPETWAFSEPIYKRVLEHGRPVHLQDQEFVIMPSGIPESRFFTISYSPARNESGQVIGIMVVTIETTTRVQMERLNAALLNKSISAREQMKHMFKQAPGFMVMLRGPEHIVELANDAYLALSGVSNIIGKRLRDAIPESEKQGFIKILDKVFTSGIPFVAKNMPIQLPRAADGVLEQRFLNFVYQPLRDADGFVHCIFVEGTDVTDQYRQAEELARVNRELAAERDEGRAILDGMSDGFGLLDREWRLVYMNSEGLRLAQRQADQAIGHNHWEVWPEVRGTQLETVYRRVAETGMPESFEQLITLEPEPPFWLEVRVQRTPAGELAIFYHDITDRKALEITMEDVTRHRDEFLVTLAHELRNPLAPICASADLLSQGPPAPERVKKVGAIIRRQSAIMKNLIDDLLDVSRVTQGFVKLEMATVDMTGVLHCALEQVSPSLEAHGHSLVTEIPEMELWVSGDEHRLVQIVTNLLNNAIKYTHCGGCITVKVERKGAATVLTVSDTGVGMPPDFVSKAFDLFSQAERTPDRIQGGLGIGLSLVKSLVTLHAGTVVAQSEGPGRGSMFTVTLPHVDGPAPRP